MPAREHSWIRRAASFGLAGLVVTLLPWTGAAAPAAAIPLAPSDEFAYHVAIDGDTAVLGAPTDDTLAGSNAGSASVFVRSGTEWTLQQKLIAPDGKADDGFGRWLDISGDTVVVSAPSHGSLGRNKAGAVYVYVRTGTTWDLQDEITPDDARAGDLFGRSVAVSADTMVVGSPFHDTLGGADAGSAYIYTRANGDWTLQQQVMASNGAVNDRFGHAVDIDSDTVVVGAPLENSTAPRKDAGAAYAFFRNGTVWSQQARLLAFDRFAQDHFGRWVSVDGDTIAVGSPGDDLTNGRTDAGSTYVFVRSGTTWSHQQKLTAADALAGDAFGFRVDINGDTIAVGAPDDDTTVGSNAGTAHVFVRTGTTWSLQVQLFEPDAAATDQFGRGVAVSGDTLVVGAPYDNNTTGIDAGSAYVYLRSGVDWTLQATLTDLL
jgi:hypothetical protein